LVEAEMPVSLRPQLLVDTYRVSLAKVGGGRPCLPKHLGDSGFFRTKIGPAGTAQPYLPVRCPTEKNTQLRKLARAIRVLEERHHQQLSMEELAELVGMSSTHFNRQFSSLLGTSPTRLLHAMRIDCARHPLATTDQTIADIAVEIGSTLLSGSVSDEPKGVLHRCRNAIGIEVVIRDTVRGIHDLDEFHRVVAIPCSAHWQT
jgi:AraC-like DNA-binding protein